MTLQALPILFCILVVAMLALALACVLPPLMGWRARVMTATAVGNQPSTEVASGSGRVLPLVLAVALPMCALGLYALLGDPGAARRAASLPTIHDPASPGGMRAELVRHLAASPRDGRGWVLLARMDFAADRFGDAVVSYEKAVAANPKIANDPAVLCELADALGMTQGGALAGRPRDLVRKALAVDPAHPKALEMAGSAAFELQDYAGAAGYWRELLPLLPDHSPEQEALAVAIARADALAGRAGLQVQGSGAGR